MPCMVTMNVKTEHNLVNGTWGQIVDIILDPRENDIEAGANVVYLCFHNVEVMVYQCDRFFGYGYWMTSIPTITHILIFCCILIILIYHYLHVVFLPCYILFKLDETKAQSLDGLPEGMFPIEPASCRYMLDVDGHWVTAERKQEPVTGGYAFTGYHSQGQTMLAVIVDLAKPPSGKQMSFGAYVALSQS